MLDNLMTPQNRTRAGLAMAAVASVGLLCYLTIGRRQDQGFAEREGGRATWPDDQMAAAMTLMRPGPAR